MFFKRSESEEKIKKRTVKNIDERVVVLARKKRKVRKTEKLGLCVAGFLMALAFLGITGYALFLAPFLNITKIEVAGTEKIDPNIVVRDSEEFLAGKYLGYFPKNNMILADISGLEQALKGKFKRIDTVMIKKIFPETLSISIIERKTSLIFCSDNRCFVLDENGTSFAEANFSTNDLGEQDLPVIFNDANKGVALGENIVDAGYIGYLEEIRNRLKDEIGINIEKEMHTPQLVSGDIRVRTSDGMMIFFSKSIQAQKEIEMLKLFLEKMKKSDVENKKNSEFDYIDLRIDNKIYYKLKNVSDIQQDTQKEEPAAQSATGDEKSETSHKKKKK